MRDIETSFLAAAESGWSAVLLHLRAQIAELLARALSPGLGVLEIHELDQLYWGHARFVDGEERARFTAAQSEPGAPDAVAEVFGVERAVVAREHAFSHDEFDLLSQ